MTQHILFIHGAGEGAYEADKKLAESLQQTLGAEYEVHCPAMPNEDYAPYDQWTQKIEGDLAEMPAPVILVGHSLGGSVIAKWMSELPQAKLSASAIRGVYLISTPFWGGDGWKYEGYETLELADGLAAKLPDDLPVALYHARDDEVVPFDHLALFAKVLPQARVHEVDEGGHQFNDDLSVVAEDIKRLS